MYHIMIVDDEFLVRLGLKTTINWSDHGYKVVGEASNGKEALDMVRTLKPDIVLVDIKMPLMDGLGFITEARKLNEDISFVILSNYESFSYAKRALELGVSQYILKSEINEEVLLAALNSIKQEKDSERSRYHDKKHEQKQYLKNNLLKGQINVCLPIAGMEAPSEGLFPEEKYVVIKYFCNISLMSQQSIDMLAKMLGSLIDEEYAGAIYSETIFQSYYYLTLIYPCGSAPRAGQYYIDKSNSLGRKLKYYFSVRLKGGISEENHPMQMRQMLREAELAREQCFFCDEFFILYQVQFEELAEKVKDLHISNTRISGYLKERDKEGLKQYIHEKFVTLKEQRRFNAVRHGFIDFLSIAKANVEKLDEESAVHIKNKLDYDNWNQLTSIEETESYIVDIFDSVLGSAGQSDSRYSSSVKQSIAYIEKHYHLNITLEDVSRHVEISKSYLSMLFKQETGTNLVTYINQYRIEEGKKLLVATKMKIYEIADAIGFGSPYYFSKVFKEITGMQCKEYRDTFIDTEEE